MPLQALIVGLVLIPALLLIALVWWRFFGRGKETYTKTNLPDIARYSTVKKYRYDASDFIKPAVQKSEEPKVSPGENIIQKLVDNTNRRAAYFEKNNTIQTKLFSDKEENRRFKTSAPAGEFTEDLFPEIGPREVKPVSTYPDTASGSSENPEDEPDQIAPSLFHNAVTAPANTDNDIKNRQAVSEHRTRKGAALRAKLTTQKEALGDLFLGKPTIVNPTAESGEETR